MGAAEWGDNLLGTAAPYFLRAQCPLWPSRVCDLGLSQMFQMSACSGASFLGHIPVDALALPPSPVFPGGQCGNASTRCGERQGLCAELVSGRPARMAVAWGFLDHGMSRTNKK